MKQIIAITGPSGVGKTDTGWAILEHLSRQGIAATLMDADWYANSRPFDWNQAADLNSVFEQIEMIATHHFANGRDVLIIPHCHQIAFHFERLEKFGVENKIKINRICLLCAVETLKQRINLRDRPAEQKENEFGNAHTHLSLFQEQALQQRLGIIVDNSYLSEDETAEHIIKYCFRDGTTA